MCAQIQISLRMRQSLFNPKWNKLTDFVYWNFIILNNLNNTRSYSRVFLRCDVLLFYQNFQQKDITLQCTTLMCQFYISATRFGYPTVAIIRLNIRSIRKKLITYNLRIVISIFCELNLANSNVITYTSICVCYLQKPLY